MSKRVYAVLGADRDRIQLIGFGEYTGDEVPSEEAAGPMAKAMHEVGIPNPKIVLDNGEVVWGCECWWGPEDEWSKIAEGKTIINVDMAAERVKVQS